MDMMPTQDNPAHVSTSNEAAIAAAQRLADTQAWIVAQEAALPVAPNVATDDALQPYLARLDAWWEKPVESAPGQPALPRHDVLATRLAAVMKDNAELLGMDGTLDARAVTLATAVSRGNTPLPTGVHARELVIGNVALAGAMVATDDAQPDLAVSFMPEDGWRAYPSLDALYREIEIRTFQKAMTDTPVPGVSAADLENVIGERFVSSRPFEGAVFGAMVQRIRHVQEDHAMSAWALAGVAGVSMHDGQPIDLPAAVARSIVIHPHVDVASMFDRRNTALEEAIVEEQLTHVAPGTATAWRNARSAYDATLAEAREARLDPSWADPEPLATYARTRLKAELARMGIMDDPDTITVDVLPAPRSPGIPNVIDDVNWLMQPAAGTVLETHTFTDLALSNLAATDRRRFVARGAEGRDLSQTLRSSDMVTLLRTLDIGGNYRADVARVLGKSQAGAPRRKLAKELQMARMRLELEDARVGEAQPGAPRAFNEDREQRGYLWVRAVLDAAMPGAGPATALGHPLVVSQVRYQDRALKDVLMISTPTRTAVRNVIFYTPDAPDGRTFREFDDLAHAEAEFLYERTFEDYLLDRLHPSAAETTDNGVRRFRVSHATALSDFALNNGRAFGTKTDEAFQTRSVRTDFLADWHDASLSHLDARLALLARSAGDADSSASFHIDHEAIARQVSRFVGRPFQAAWRAYDAAKTGDYVSAFIDFTEAYVAGIDMLGTGATLNMAMKPILIRAVATRTALPGMVTKSPKLIPSGVRISAHDIILEPRFLAKNVSIRNATSFENGVYTIGGKTYVSSGESLYGVQRDTVHRVWRLARQDGGALTASPPLMRQPSGRWGIDREFGLPGGAPPRVPGEPAQGAVPRSGGPLANALRRLVHNVGPLESVRIAHTLRSARGRVGGAFGELNPIQQEAYRQAFSRFRQQQPVAGVRPIPLARHAYRNMPRANPLDAVDLRRTTSVPPADWPETVYMRVQRYHVHDYQGVVIPGPGGLIQLERPLNAAGPFHQWIGIPLRRLAASRAPGSVNGLSVWRRGTSEADWMLINSASSGAFRLSPLEFSL